MVSGNFYNLVTSQYAQIHITDIPVRASLASTESELCSNDSTILVVTLNEPYQIDRANLRIVYDTNLFKATDFTTYFQNMDFDIDMVDDYINIGIHVIEAVNLDEAIIASFKFETLASYSSESIFSWDEANTYFINENNDTIIDILNGTQIQINLVETANFDDSLTICRGQLLELEEGAFQEILWNTGETTSGILPLEEDLYWVQLKDQNLCPSVDSFYVEIREWPEAPSNIFTQGAYYCEFNDSIPFEVFGGFGEYLNVFYEDQWFIDSSHNGNSFLIPNPGHDINLNVFWQNECGLSDTVSQEIQIYEESTPSVEIWSDYLEHELGDLVQFNAQSEDEGQNPTYIWKVDQEIVQVGSRDQYETVGLSQNQIISVDLYSNEKCILGSSMVSDSMQVKMKVGAQYYIPSVVTPNGDGIDDSFRAYFKTQDFTQYHLMIFDLMGRMVFETNSYSEQWTGNDSEPHAIEMYTYLLIYQQTTLDKKTLSGKFLLKK